MKHPQPSLPDDVKSRSFIAANGELGLHISDIAIFLDACLADGISVLGWEAWLINHRGLHENSPGSWTGLIPKRDGSIVVIGGDGDADEVRKQCAAFEPNIEVAKNWLPYLRVNISISY